MAKLLYDCPMYGFKAGDEVEMYPKDTDKVQSRLCENCKDKSNKEIKKTQFKGGY